MKLKNVYCLEAVKVGALIATYFNSDKYDLSIDENFAHGVTIKDKTGSAVVPFSNLKHWTIDEPKEKPAKK